jgi:molybdopterin/thiamine biosynthesis adenylyltransferase
MTDDWVGKPRVYKAQQTLAALNPDIEIEAVCEYVSADNIDELVQTADIALDCAFDFKERDLLNGACVRHGKPMVEAAMNSMEAYLTTIVPGQTPCLTCLYPEKPDWDRWGFGVLGAVSGTLACLAALEAIKLITGLGRAAARPTADDGFGAIAGSSQVAPNFASCAISAVSLINALILHPLSP